jgi:phenylacetate-CoA ligase
VAAGLRDGEFPAGFAAVVESRVGFVEWIPFSPYTAVAGIHQISKQAFPSVQSEPIEFASAWLDRATLERLQLQRLQELLQTIIPRNRFWTTRLKAAGVEAAAVRSLDDLQRFPFCSKHDFVADQDLQPPYGSNLTYPSTRYRRVHQTSGTTGRPLRWMDTQDSWDWLLSCWRQIYTLAGVNSWDRLFFPFSFGPFLGFWAAFEGGLRFGNFCISGGGMSTSLRLKALLENEATIVCCTPTYALRMAEVAAAEGVDLQESSVRMLIVAGEPGGTIPTTRHRISELWDARVIDHWGMTEAGSLAAESEDRPGGMYLLETECLAEVLRPGSGELVAPGEPGELVITTLGRTGSPLLRYRTGDLVCCSQEPDPFGRQLKWLQGGILGRVDEMVIVRGNNVYPSSIEAVVRGIPEITEFQLELSTVREMRELCVVIEPSAAAADRVCEVEERLRSQLRARLGFSVDVRAVHPGELPRFEMKSRRVVTVGGGGGGSAAGGQP